MLTHHTPIERISTRAGNKRWREGETIFEIRAILHERPDIDRRLSCKHNGHTPFNKGIDGFLKAVN
jgi:hypothetical protein